MADDIGVEFVSRLKALLAEYVFMCKLWFVSH